MRFREGFHCSQSVLEAYPLDIGLEAELSQASSVRARATAKFSDRESVQPTGG